MIEITIRYQVNFDKMINKIYILGKITMVKKEKAQIINIMNEKISNNTDATVLVR